VKGDYFELALNSFLKVQFESLHAKEPFLPHTTYLRLAYALKLCYNNAKPHVFATANKTKKKCKGKVMQVTILLCPTTTTKTNTQISLYPNLSLSPL